MIFGLRNVMLFAHSFKQLNKSEIVKLSQEKENNVDICISINNIVSGRLYLALLPVSSFKIIIFTKIVLTVISLA